MMLRMRGSLHRRPAAPQQYSAPVAQLDRVPGYEPGGREFESLRARHPAELSRIRASVQLFCLTVLVTWGYSFSGRSFRIEHDPLFLLDLL